MNSIPKVSVLLVVYNQACFIKETLDSIIAQDYVNLEIVVSDDASTDGTRDILREYANNHPDKILLIFNQKNLGITGNCNKALSACTGEFISLFAGDDVMLPGKISAQVQEFISNPAVTLCYHSVEIFESSSNKKLYVTFENSYEIIRSVEDIIVAGGFPGTTSVMVRHAACPSEGFDSRLPTVSDWMFIIEVALKGKITFINKIYSRYRKHKKGTTYNLIKYLEETLKTMDLIIDKYPEHTELVKYCQKGKARYLAGEAFRQLDDNPAFARILSKRALYLDPGNFKYKTLSFLSRFNILIRLLGPLLNRNKYIIKRFLLF